MRLDDARERLESLGPSPAMRELRAAIVAAASAGRDVVLRGEPGTGRRWIAWTIHCLAGHEHNDWVEADARELAPDQLDQLLRRAGSGTLLLRERSDSVESVASAARARERMRVAARVVATAEELRDAATAAEPRVVGLRLPPLRERAREDVAAVLASVHRALRAEIGGGPPRLDDSIRQRLLGHSWPGNIREMRNALERALIAAGSAAAVTADHLLIELRTDLVGERGTRPATLAEVERAHIEQTVRRHSGNRTHAARELGISRATLINKIRAYALDV